MRARFGLTAAFAAVIVRVVIFLVIIVIAGLGAAVFLGEDAKNRLAIPILDTQAERAGSANQGAALGILAAEIAAPA